MNTIQIHLTDVQKADLPVLEAILKKFKIKSNVIEQEDDTKMTKEEYFRMIEKSSKSPKRTISKEELRLKLLS